MRCLMWKFPIPCTPRSLEFWHLRAVINFSLGPENWTLLRKSAKKGQVKDSLFCYEWEQRKGHYDVDGSFKLPSQKWKWHVSIRTGGNLVFEFPTCEDASHLQATTSQQHYEPFGRELCTLQILNCTQVIYQARVNIQLFKQCSVRYYKSIKWIKSRWIKFYAVNSDA
jgi:hypothetical protein